MKVDINRLEAELKRRLLEPYVPWGRRQNNDWDRMTNFIYRVQSWSKLKDRVDQLDPRLRNYAVNRWFNFWSAVGVECIFCQQLGVVAAKNEKDRLIDFSIQGINFDHKTTVYPRGFRQPVGYAQSNPAELIEWLYCSQSRQQRLHYGNRLFLVLFDAVAGAHWRLRAELNLIGEAIEAYVREFDPDRLISIEVNGHKPLADLIWIVRQ